MAEALETLKSGVEGARAAADGEQLDLLPGSRRIPQNDDAAIDAQAARDRAAGRPKGAENKATGELRRFVLQVFGSPVVQLAQWAQLSPEELARRLGISVVEAFDRKMELLEKVAPYVHARVAPTDDKGNAVPIFNIGLAVGTVPGAIAQGAAMPWDYVNPVQQNQQVIEAEATESQNEESQK